MPMAMDLKEETNSLLVMSSEGRWDTTRSKSEEQPFLEMVQSATKSLLIDLSAVPSISSMGLRMLIEGSKRHKAKGLHVALLRPSPFVKKTLTSSGLDRLLPSFETVTEAEAALRLHEAN